jgi:hypothetical protein
MFVSGSTLIPYINGTAQNTKTGTTGATTVLDIGSYLDSSQSWNGYIGDIIIYSSALSTEQRQKVEGFLAWKWSLTRLFPSTHPHRLYPPSQDSFVQITPPGTPTLNTPTNTTTTLNMSWTAGSGGTPVSYTVTVYAAGVLVTGSGGTQTISHPTTSTTFSPMISGTAYTFFVSATNSGGTSATAGPSSSVTYTAGAGYAYSATLLGFPATTGYTQYTGSFTNIDDGYSSTPLTLPVAFSTNAQSSSLLYMSTNGFFTLGSGSGSIVSTPQSSANPAFMAGNPGDNWLQSGLVNSDGDTQNWWYQTGSSGGKSFVRNIVKNKRRDKFTDLYSPYLDQQKIPYAYIDGSVRERMKEVEKFQEQDTHQIFLISLKAGGTGLNLTAAEYVFILDPWWNPAAERQASDRAHRIGQTKTVFIYKFISRNTIEEKILKLQERKSRIAAELIQVEEDFFKNLTDEDIRNLLD